MQQRLESSVWGRVAISIFVLATVPSIFVANLYPSELRDRVSKVTKPYVHVLGMDQGWDVFSPDPRRLSFDFRAEIEYADGTRSIWRIPRNDSVIGAYRDYRWRKWVEWAIADDESQLLWKPYAEWLARLNAKPGRRPVRVTMVRRSSQVFPPGPGPSHARWREAVYYRLSVTPQILEGPK